VSKKLFALRGATQTLNTAEDIEKWTAFLYDGLLKLNKLEEDAIVSIVFSMTSDLDEENPAAALRHAGRVSSTPLFVAQEAFVRGGLPRTIRALIHCYLDEGAVARHFYCNGAETLRPDWAGTGGAETM
jgi:chorismate mutase